jgi:hypothetical protein
MPWEGSTVTVTVTVTVDLFSTSSLGYTAPKLGHFGAGLHWRGSLVTVTVTVTVTVKITAWDWVFCMMDYDQVVTAASFCSYKIWFVRYLWIPDHSLSHHVTLQYHDDRFVFREKFDSLSCILCLWTMDGLRTRYTSIVLLLISLHILSQ